MVIDGIKYQMSRKTEEKQQNFMEHLLMEIAMVLDHKVFVTFCFIQQFSEYLKQLHRRNADERNS